MSVALFRPRFQIGTFLKFTAICGLMLAIQRGSGAGLGIDDGGVLSVAYPLGLAVFCALLFLRPRPKPLLTAPSCRACGRPCVPSLRAEPDRLCPTCRHHALPPRERRRREFVALAFVATLFLLLSLVVLWPVSLVIPGGLNGSAYPALAVILFVVLFALYSGAMIAKHLARSWRMTRPGHALNVARTCAGEAGEQRTFGAVTVYTLGAKDPTAMLKAQMETSRDRFTELIGGPPEAERPLRVLAFGKKGALDAFIRRAFFFGTNLHGMYVPWNPATIALTTDLPSHGLVDPERLARVLLGYFHLDTDKRGRLPQWLQMGAAGHLACGRDGDELARLNRRMLASLSKSTALGVDDFFRPHPRMMIKLLRDWEDHANFTRYAQFGAQSWSVVEYLCDEDRRDRFRGFLKDCRAGEPHEPSLRRHFGHGYDTLLEHWRASVLARGIGAHGPLPPHLRSAFRESVIPAIADRNSRPIERIEVIREMGRVGYAAGADALIGLLGTDDAIPGEEIAWSLEAISGLALGPDRRAWLDWHGRLPEDATGVADLIGSAI